MADHAHHAHDHDDHDHDHDHDDDHGHHGHSHGHGHAHGHHGHSHAPASFGRAFLIGTTLNLGFVVVEAVYGLVSDSMSLLADAGHNFSDVIGLVMAWMAATLAKRAPSGRFTYGLGGSSILAALMNAVLLLVATGAIVLEAVHRLLWPAPVAGPVMMVVAAIGILINGGTALMFASGRKGDINIRGAFLHMAGDALVSAGVVVAGFAILKTGWDWIDPAASLLICLAIAIGTWGLLRDSLAMSLAAAPPGIDPAKVEAWLAAQPGVAAVHDLHIWPMSTTETALTAHLLIPAGYPGDGFAAGVAEALQHRFHIGHTTIQIETDRDQPCTMAAH